MRHGNRSRGGDWRSAHLPPAARERFEREQRHIGQDEDEDWLDDEDEWLDDEEIFTEDDAKTAFLSILDSVERCRAQLRDELALLARALQEEPELQRQWQEFTRVGGVTADEFRRFLEGRFRHRRTRQRRHMRLVASNTTKPARLRRSGGDEAA